MKVRADRQRLPPPGRAGLRRSRRRSSTSPTSRPSRGARSPTGEVAERARAQAAGLDALGIGAGERVAIVCQNSARLLTAFFGVSGCGRDPRADQLPARSPTRSSYIVEHSGARVLLVDPELDEALAGVDGRAPLRDRRRERRRAVPLRRRARAVGARRGRHRARSTTRAAPRPGRRACSSPTATSGSTPPRSAGRWASATATSTCTRCRSSTATAGACCTRSPAWAAATSCCARSTAPRSCAGSTQHGVTLLCGAPAVVAMILDAAATWDGPIPGRGRVRIVVAGAPPPTRTIERSRPSSAGSSSRSTGSPRPRRCSR